MADNKPFFVGYLPTPRALLPFLILVTALVIGVGVGTGVAFVISQQDPGDGHWAWGEGYQTLTGRLSLEPTPVLHMPPDADHPDGRAVLLVGQGKRDVRGMAGPLDGKIVDAGGFMLYRGPMEMMQVGGKVKLREAEDPTGLTAFSIPEAQDLGRHELRGEIVDGKCCIGAMRPGVGKVHRGCANLCLIGGIPPLFVTFRGGGTLDYFVLADADGKDMTADVLDITALYVGGQGQVLRTGPLKQFRVDRAALSQL